MTHVWMEHKPECPFAKHKAELKALEEMPEDQIDTSDIPEQTDWAGAERGRFCDQRLMVDP